MLSLRYQRKKLQNLSHLICGFQIRQIWIQLITACGILPEKVYNTCITDLDELKQRLRTERAKLDHVIIAAAIRQWRRR